MSNRRSSTAFETLQRRSSVQTPTLPRKFSLFNDNRSSQGEPRGRKLSFGEKQAKKRSSISKVREKDCDKKQISQRERDKILSLDSMVPVLLWD
uniref:Uncharacterized protein n=1 Tax=Magallana gigas TaxID=29159 RepID=A0A8W8MZ51_MAGGI